MVLHLLSGIGIAWFYVVLVLHLFRGIGIAWYYVVLVLHLSRGIGIAFYLIFTWFWYVDAPDVTGYKEPFGVTRSKMTVKVL